MARRRSRGGQAPSLGLRADGSQVDFFTLKGALEDLLERLARGMSCSSPSTASHL